LREEEEYEEVSPDMRGYGRNNECKYIIRYSRMLQGGERGSIVMRTVKNGEKLEI
jgi:hypothetical protein